MDIESVVRLVALLLAALMTGALMVNWIGLARAMSQMSSAAAYTEFHQATNRTFDPYMPSIGFGAIVGGIALAAFFSGGHSASGWLAIGGTICYVLAIAICLSTNVPINKAFAGWSIQSPPDNWKDVREEWIRWHIFRILVSIPALLCYLLGVLLAGR